jgi:hypothetical protein
MENQDMQRIIEMLAKLDANQEKAEADRKTNKEDFMARMDANMKAWREKADADMKAWEEICWMLFETMNTRNETWACQEMEVCQEEEGPTSVEMKPEATEEEEVPAVGAEVMSVREPKKKRRRDRKLAAEHHRQMKERTQDGCRGRLVVAHRGTSRRVDVAKQKKSAGRCPTMQQWHGARGTSSENL